MYGKVGLIGTKSNKYTEGIMFPKKNEMWLPWQNI